MNYLNRQWPRFVTYLDDGQVEVDNNRCERMVRPFTIGRKNWSLARPSQELRPVLLCTA